MRTNVFIITFFSFYLTLTVTLTDSCAKHVVASQKNNINVGQLINSWTQGKIDQNGKVVQADIKRGGWYKLSINSDTTVIFNGSLNCGFGSESQGKWALNGIDSTVAFAFSKIKGYGNKPGTTDTNFTEIYKINKLTADELILTRTVDGKAITMPFIKTNK
jgi:hypothetical protein